MKYCSIEGCGKKKHARNLCSRHYSQWYQRGGKKTTEPRVRGTCSIEGCNKPHRARGFCIAHHTRFLRWGSADVVHQTFEHHGLHRHPLYPIWVAMKDRCFNPRNKYYEDYGGRSVVVCRRWKESFQAFYDDMAPRPEGLTLERTDNDGNYSCGKCPECVANGWIANCRWATRSEQNKNRRTNKNSTSGHKGVSRHRNKWAANLTINHEKRIYIGIYATKEEAIAAHEAAKKRYHGDAPQAA